MNRALSDELTGYLSEHGITGSEHRQNPRFTVLTMEGMSVLGQMRDGTGAFDIQNLTGLSPEARTEFQSELAQTAELFAGAKSRFTSDTGILGANSGEGDLEAAQQALEQAGVTDVRAPVSEQTGFGANIGASALRYFVSSGSADEARDFLSSSVDDFSNGSREIFIDLDNYLNVQVPALAESIVEQAITDGNRLIAANQGADVDLDGDTVIDIETLGVDGPSGATAMQEYSQVFTHLIATHINSAPGISDMSDASKTALLESVQTAVEDVSGMNEQIAEAISAQASEILAPVAAAPVADPGLRLELPGVGD